MPAPPPPSSLVSCVDALNALFYCASPVNQGDRYYKDGALDSCARQLAEMKLCLQLKVAGPERTRAIVRQLLDDGAAASPTIGVVWPPRKHLPDSGASSDVGAGER